MSNLACDSTDELDPQADGSRPCKDTIGNDDENLLGGEVGTGNGSGNDSWGDNASMSKEERLRNYSATCDEDNSSQDSSNVDEDDECSRASEELATVEYVAQLEGDNAEDGTTAPAIDDSLISMNMVEDAPQLQLSVEAASSADNLADAAKLSCINSLSRSNSEETDGSKATPASSDEKGATIGNAVGYISNSSSSSSSGVSSSNSQEDGKPTNVNGDDERSNQIVMADSSRSNEESSEDGSGAEDGKQKARIEPSDLEESASLVGVELVPSFGANSGKTGSYGLVKDARRHPSKE